MPWKADEGGRKIDEKLWGYMVVSQATGKPCSGIVHPSKDAVRAHLRSLYVIKRDQ